MERSNFLKRMTLIAGAGLVGMNPLLAQIKNMISPKLLGNIGIQLFSLPFVLEKDFRGGIEMLSKMGYREIEMYGPYPYSSNLAKKRWASIVPQIGFSGSGYFGLPEKEVKAIFNDNRMKVPSIHTDLNTLENHMDRFAKAAEVIGFEYIVIPAIHEEQKKTQDDFKRIADTFNSVGKKAKEVGLKFTFHNHGFGLSEVNGEKPLDFILDHTDPELVYLEMDLFWTISGGADPIAYLKKYSNRYHLMHVKDMKEKKTFSGDGGDPGQWMELFPNMTTAGSGVLELEKILPFALENGVKHFFVEQDMVAEPQEALKNSFDYLASL